MAESPMDARPGTGLACLGCVATVTQPGGLHPHVANMFRRRRQNPACDIREVGHD